MKKIISKAIHSFAALFLLSAFASCLSDMEVETPQCDNLTIHVAFTKSATPPSLTRLTESGDHDGTFNENKVEKLDIFFYQGNQLKWKALSADMSYNAATNIATLPVPADKKALFQGNVSYDVYVVANSNADYTGIAEEAVNAADLKNLVVQSGDFVAKGGSATPQNSFLMDGVITKNIHLNSPDLGTVNLERAAAKIRLRLINVVVPGFERVGNASAKLMHFTDKTALMSGGSAPTLASADWKETSAMPLSATAPANVGGGETTPTPFYAYANNWQNDGSLESYIDLTLPLKDTENDITGDFKYRIPLTPQTLTGNDATNYKNVLRRNYLYDIAVTIKILGRIDEEPEVVTGNYTIQSWNEEDIYIKVMGAHYLVVSEQNVVMPNIAAYTLTFNSSIAGVTLVPGSLKATYTYVPAGGSAPVTKNVDPGQMPTVTVQPNVASGTIGISSPIPVNYIPKDIEFQVTNGPLTEKVVIRQLPATYFTTTKGVQSYMPGEGIRNVLPTGNTNPYMYAITSLAPAGDIIWGFPPTDADGNTVNSYEVSQMVSPKFEMASQFGASVPKGYNDAKTQCQGYWEKAEDGTVKDGWRLPTVAEIAYIDALQQEVATGYVMKGRYYWSNWSQYPTQRLRGNGTSWSPYYFESGYDGAYRMGKGIYDNANDFVNHYNAGATYNNAHVRCIRDITE